MIKIAHESPKSIFLEVQKVTDYDYALVHLFDEDPEYKEMFYKAKADGREIVLDNSIFELGEAFDMQKFANWVIDLKPSWYIVPDSLENAHETMNNMEIWEKEYLSSIPKECKRIGVVQGKTYDEIVMCYTYMKTTGVDKIAIPFDLSLYTEMVPHPNTFMSYMLGRIALIGRLYEDKILDVNRPHHLLGTALPQEGKFYDSKHYSFIDSVDTSNPVVHGIVPDAFYDAIEGLQTKNSIKLYTMINMQLDGVTRDRVIENIWTFRKFWHDYYERKSR